MELHGTLQANGIVNLPQTVRLDCAAISVELTVDRLAVAVQVALMRWEARSWFRLPSEIFDLVQPGAFSYRLTPSVGDVRMIVPQTGLVRFRAMVRGKDAFKLAVPAAWYRGIKHLGWTDTVRTRIQFSDGADYTFTQQISVRGRAITLTVPKKVCTTAVAGDAILVELTRVVEHVPKPDLADLDGYPVAAWSTWTQAQQDDELNRLVQRYRQHGFPWEAVLRKREDRPLDGVQKSRLTVDGDTISRVGYAGQGTCTSVHKQRYRARYHKQCSVVEAFDDDRKLRRALAFQLKCGDPVTPHRLLNALSALHRSPLNFPPTLARWLVDQYVPENGVVLDPCSGFGGRLLGTLASKQNAHYIGADIEPDNALANRELAALVGVADRVQQFCRAVEDPAVWPTADVVLLGPPYYNREDYGVVSAAAIAQYATYAAWVDGFLTTLLKKSLGAAKLVILNIAELKDGTQILDLPNDAIRIAAALGAVVKRTLIWELAKFGAKRQEKIIIFERSL